MINYAYLLFTIFGLIICVFMMSEGIWKVDLKIYNLYKCNLRKRNS